jgi:pantothenate kinase
MGEVPLDQCIECTSDNMVIIDLAKSLVTHKIETYEQPHDVHENYPMDLDTPNIDDILNVVHEIKENVKQLKTVNIQLITHIAEMYKKIDKICNALNIDI